MIRTLWTFLVTIAALVWWGTIVIAESLRGVRPGEWYVAITRRWARSVIWASGCPVVVHGGENVRDGVPQVVASNHISWFDVFALAAVIEVPYHFVAKKELLKIPLFGRAMEAAGHISIDRSNREAAIESLRVAGEKIRRSPGAVVIFPEGTRSRTGRLMPFKKGAFVLAAEAQVAIVPTAITGSFEIMRKGSWRIHRRTIHIHFLPPIPPR
ncbi:MAG TPA: lysophospholipid acyltransferase family protein, partial [Longimicrobiaceae bacterium]